MEILFAPIIIALITFILSTVIVVVDKLVNNYGEVDININNSKKIIRVDGGESLLTTLADAGVFIPSACGGRGSCGACKVKVLSDVGPILPTEYPLLNKKEIKENIRLSCQIKVKQNISIEIPEDLFLAKKYDCIVEKIKNVTHDIKEIKLKLNNSEKMEFSAGQYAQIIIPPYKKNKEYIQRAYSISSVPSKDNQLEFLIRLVPEGIATTYVHNYLKENEKIQIVGPFGDFYERNTTASMICVAGGSGMAPIKSIIYNKFENKIFNREIWYFFGARSLKDVFYLKELQEIEKQWPNFHFIPALSEPQKEDNWKGEIGLVTDIMDKYLKEIINIDSNKEGYLCGSPGMLKACIEVMKKNNINEEKIYYDKFA